MNVVFVKKGKYKKGDAAFTQIAEAVRHFLVLSGKPDPEASSFTADMISRTPEGRPYLKVSEGIDVLVSDSLDISVTHSGDVWMCLVSDRRCGVDFQYLKGESVIHKIERYYTEGEREYIEGGGTGQFTGSFLKTEEGRYGRFFDVWVRREALGKYEGHGLFGNYPDAAPGGMLAQSVYFVNDKRTEHKQVFIHEISASMLADAGVTVPAEFRAAVVSEIDEMPEVRLLDKGGECDV